VAGETVTAAIMNTHVRDNFKAIGDPMTAYTPTLTNITLGNGTMVGRGSRSVRRSSYARRHNAGTTTTTTGGVSISLPAAATAGSEQHLLVHGRGCTRRTRTRRRRSLDRRAARHRSFRRLRPTLQTMQMSNLTPNVGTSNMTVQGTYSGGDRDYTSAEIVRSSSGSTAPKGRRHRRRLRAARRVRQRD
jgi:hypothetical protein